MEIQNPATKLPPEIWTKIFELLNTVLPDYNKNVSTNDILNCYDVCVTFCNILRTTAISSLLPQVLPFIHPYITNNGIQPIVNCRLVCKAWKQGVDHFLENHDIFNRKQLQGGLVHAKIFISSSPNKSTPITYLFTKQDITTFIRETNNGTESPFVGNSLLLRCSPFDLDDQTGIIYIGSLSLQELLIRFGRFIKVLYLYIFQYEFPEELERAYAYRNFYGQITNILGHTPNLRRLSIQGYLNIYGRHNPWIEYRNEFVDWEVEPFNLPGIESLDIDIGGGHSFSIKLPMHLGIGLSSFSQLKRLSISNCSDTNTFLNRKRDLKIWSRACECFPNLEHLEVRVLALSNLLAIFHLASKSTKLNCLVIKIATHSWKDHVENFSAYYPYSVEPFKSLYSSEQERECYHFRTNRIELGDLLRKVETLFWKSLETLVIFVEEVARKYCRANEQDLDILREMPHLRNLQIEGFPLGKLEIVDKLPFTLNSLVLSGVLNRFHFGDIIKTNDLYKMPGVSSDLEDGWTIYQSKLWEQLPGLRFINVKGKGYTVYIYRRENRDWLITRNKEKLEQENYLLENITCGESNFCCSVV